MFKTLKFKILKKYKNKILNEYKYICGKYR
jgi:hypothetical protein